MSKITKNDIDGITKRIKKRENWAKKHLLPCPFCGDNRYLFLEYDKTTRDAFVRCVGCTTDGPLGLGKKDAIEKWNRREK